MKKSVSSKGMINFNLLSEPPLPLSLCPYYETSYLKPRELNLPSIEYLAEKKRERERNRHAYLIASRYKGG